MRKTAIIAVCLLLCVLLSSCALPAPPAPVQLTELPPYAGEAYIKIHNNTPYFEDSDKTTDSFETYSRLDALGRCGVAYANLSYALMPTEERGKIGQIKPSGWQSVKYDFVDGQSLFNRCHLIGFQLAGENANEKNLITGTRYMNTQGMLPFENMTADYIRETDNHVLYRVTPIYESSNLVASGVLMEAWSVEDSGDGLCFCVFCYNVQPGVEIDYASGDSRLSEQTSEAETGSGEAQPEQTYILNTNTMRFHYPDCSGADTIAEGNKGTFTGSRDELLAMGYSPCGSCKP